MACCSWPSTSVGYIIKCRRKRFKSALWLNTTCGHILQLCSPYQLRGAGRLLAAWMDVCYSRVILMLQVSKCSAYRCFVATPRLSTAPSTPPKRRRA